jgi:glycosyltransferase involved in cell wall biosynthesis
MDKPNISLCLIVRNELKNLKKNLAPLLKEFREVIAVDTGSNDGTREYLCTLPKHVRVINFTWMDNFSAARNQYIEVASCEWIYWMDADEYLDPSYVSILKDCSERGKDTAWAYKFGPWISFSHIKLFPNIPGIRYMMRCHEQISPSLIKAGVTKKLFFPDPFKIINPSYHQIPDKSVHRNIKLLELDIEENPEYLMSYLYLANLYCHLAQYDNAIDILEKCLSQKLYQPTSEDLSAQRCAARTKQLITLQKNLHKKAEQKENLTREELDILVKLTKQDPYIG